MPGAPENPPPGTGNRARSAAPEVLSPRSLLRTKCQGPLKTRLRALGTARGAPRPRFSAP
eukprot:10989744-Alexandrium_andersonii.AAC.1